MKKTLQILSALLVLLFMQVLLTAISSVHETQSLKDVSPVLPGDGQKFWVFNDKG